MKSFGLVRGSRLWSLFLGALGFLLCCPQSRAARSELDLGGTWQYQKVSQLTYPVAGKKTNGIYQPDGKV